MQGVCMHERVHAQGQKKILGFLELELQRLVVSCLIWVLGTEPGFGNAASALNCWAMSPIHPIHLFNLSHTAYNVRYHSDGYKSRQGIYMLLKYCTK